MHSHLAFQGYIYHSAELFDELCSLWHTWFEFFLGHTYQNFYGHTRDFAFFGNLYLLSLPFSIYGSFAHSLFVVVSSYHQHIGPQLGTHCLELKDAFTRASQVPQVKRCSLLRVWTMIRLLFFFINSTFCCYVPFEHLIGILYLSLPISVN
mgnify:CR=1 FL=1